MNTLCEKDRQLFSNNPKIVVTDHLKGRAALKKAKDMLFESKAEADTWSSRWSPSEIASGSMILYTRKKRTKTVKGLRYCIGSGANESIVGQEF